MYRNHILTSYTPNSVILQITLEKISNIKISEAIGHLRHSDI